MLVCCVSILICLVILFLISLLISYLPRWLVSQSGLATCSSFPPFLLLRRSVLSWQSQGVGYFVSTVEGRVVYSICPCGCFSVQPAGLPAGLRLSRDDGLVLCWPQPRPRSWSAASVVLINNPLSEQQSGLQRAFSKAVRSVILQRLQSQAPTPLLFREGAKPRGNLQGPFSPHS